MDIIFALSAGYAGAEMNLVHLFKALGDEARLGIVRSLAEKDLYAEVLAERLSLSPATITHHLKKLGLREQAHCVH